MASQVKQYVETHGAVACTNPWPAKIVLPARKNRYYAVITLATSGVNLFLYLKGYNSLVSGYSGIYLTGKGANYTIDQITPWNGELWMQSDGSVDATIYYTEVYEKE